MDPIEELEQAIEKFVASESGQGQQLQLTGFVLAYEALDMEDPDLKMFRSSYAVGGASSTPAQCVGLLRLTEQNVRDTLFEG